MDIKPISLEEIKSDIKNAADFAFAPDGQGAVLAQIAQAEIMFNILLKLGDLERLLEWWMGVRTTR